MRAEHEWTRWLEDGVRTARHIWTRDSQLTLTASRMLLNPNAIPETSGIGGR